VSTFDACLGVIVILFLIAWCLTHPPEAQP
jgi:hypothetical protein